MGFVTAAHLALAALLGYSHVVRSGWQSVDFTLGMVVIAGLWCLTLGLFWTIYVVSQRTITLTDQELLMRPWLRIGPFGRSLAIPLSEISRVALVRPHHVIVETRSGSEHHIGTFLWSKHDYEVLGSALEARRIPSKYSETWSYGRFLSS